MLAVYEYGVAPNNGPHPQPQQPQHFWQKPGCAASIGVTAVGALATVGEGAAIWFVGPELLAITGEAAAEETVAAGELGGGMVYVHTAEAVGTALAAPVMLTAAGVSGIATKCF
jgi:hypothetical protein